jgi:polyhydroxybutyrate depolymerase
MQMGYWRLFLRTVCIALPIGASSQSSAIADPIKLTHQGVERTVELYQPPATPGPAPLVIALHGFNQPVAGVRSWLNLDATADREKFVVAYPAAINLAWSYGRPINQPMPKAGGETVDDLGFIDALIDHLVKNKIADSARIYVVGASRGGLMAFTLACARADRIAAAAALITGMTEYQREDCRPTRAVPIMAIAGTADRVQSFGGAQGLVGRLLSVPESMNFWRELHGCIGRSERTLPHLSPDDPTRVIVLEWARCRTGASMRVYRVVGGGHQPPSIALRASPQSEQRMGLRNRDIETSDEIWSFFRQFRR